MREAVRAPDHEGAERVLGAQGSAWARTCGRACRLSAWPFDLSLPARRLAIARRRARRRRRGSAPRRQGRRRCRAPHEIGEVSLDPGPGELVRHAHLEHVALQRKCPGRREPRAEDHRREVVPDAIGDRGPEQGRCGGIVYGHSYARPRRRRVSIDAVRTGRGVRMLPVRTSHDRSRRQRKAARSGHS